MPCITIRKASFEIYDFVMKAIFVVRTKLFTILSSLLLVFPYLLIVGCVAPHPAPVVESQRNLNQTSDKVVVTDKQIYIVQRGDTLYGVALRHGIDYRELAQWNGIVDPNALRIGQEIDLSVPSRQKSYSPHEQVVEQQLNAAQPTLFSVPQPILSSDVEQLPSSISQSDMEVSAGSLVTEPKGIKLPYSETAVAQLQDSARPSSNTPPKVETVAMAPVTQKIIERESTPPKISPQMPETRNASNIKWSWPTNGQVLSRYTEKSKGVSISGRSGQSIVASADGTVVYSGSGLRGYGKLIIVKHNDTYLSAYGHNSKILVREGEAVTKGQKIAEMGNTDSDIVKLHFEIRERGKPVDPLKFLSN
jgi:lipoprotein NlpD